MALCFPKRNDCETGEYAENKRWRVTDLEVIQWKPWKEVEEEDEDDASEFRSSGAFYDPRSLSMSFEGR